MSAQRRSRGILYLVPNLLGIVPPAAVLPQRTIDIARRLQRYVVETPKVARQFIKALAPAHAIQEIAFAKGLLHASCPSYEGPAPS